MLIVMRVSLIRFYSGRLKLPSLGDSFPLAKAINWQRTWERRFPSLFKFQVYFQRFCGKGLILTIIREN